MTANLRKSLLPARRRYVWARFAFWFVVAGASLTGFVWRLTSSPINWWWVAYFALGAMGGMAAARSAWTQAGGIRLSRNPSHLAAPDVVERIQACPRYFFDSRRREDGSRNPDGGYGYRMDLIFQDLETALDLLDYAEQFVMDEVVYKPQRDWEKRVNRLRATVRP